MATPSWLTYANAGATRNQPLSPELVQALSFLGDMGVTMDVFSGGQPSSGPNRTGSHRHDHGNAADVFFRKDGRQLDWANEADRSVFQDIVKQAKANGVTGFGAGDGYMRPGSMHIGFGSPAVWGAGGSGGNAPSWLRAAYNGSAAPAPSSSSPPIPAQPPQNLSGIGSPTAPSANQPAPPPAQAAPAPAPPNGLLAALGMNDKQAGNLGSMLSMLGQQSKAPEIAPMPAPQAQVPALMQMVSEFLASRKV